FLAAVAPVIETARALERTRRAPPPHVRPTSPLLAETGAGLVMLHGHPYLAAASTVTPEHADGLRAPGPSVLVVSAQRVDGALLTSLRQLHLRNVRVEAVTADAPGALALTDIRGRAIGRIAWTPERP